MSYARMHSNASIMAYEQSSTWNDENIKRMPKSAQNTLLSKYPIWMLVKYYDR